MEWPVVVVWHVNGRFISLEGGEGVGKSTQALRLKTALEARGISVLLTREPGGSEGAETIRDILMAGALTRWSAHTEALLFAAARADHVEKLIRPAIAAGRWVICDRFIDSSRAYQGLAGGIDDAAILALHAFGAKGVLPDRTFLFDLPIEEGRVRAARRDGSATDRFAARGSDFHAQVAAAFLSFAAREPDRFRVVNAENGPEAITDALLVALSDWLE